MTTSGPRPTCPPTSPMLLAAREVATILNVKRPRVYELIREGVLPAVRLLRQIRVREADLLAFIEKGGQGLDRNIGGRGANQ